MIGRKEKIKGYFDSVATNYTRYRNGKNYYWSSITNHCNFFLTGQESVIDIGCGTGQTLNKLNAKRKVGIDFSEKMIEVAQNGFPQIEFHLMEAEKIGLNEKFDVIIISNVMGLFDNIQEVLESVQTLMNANSKVFISYYNYLWEPFLRLAEWVGLKNKAPEQAWLSRKDIENLVYLSGMEPYKKTSDVLLPIRIPLISFIMNKILARLPLFSSFCLNSYFWCRKVQTFEDVKTTVVIPARNESGNIEDAIKRLPKFGSGVELIFVEGNSTDDTWEKINAMYNLYKDQIDIKIIQQEGKGKGDAVRKGYSMATGEVLMILDADLTVPPEELPKFYQALMSGKGEFINGSRLVYPMEKKAMRPLNVLGNKFFSMAFSWILEMPIKDTLCGTKVMFRKDYERLVANRAYFGEFDPFGDYDLIFGSYKLNLKIIDLPIRYRERLYGDTNISRFKHGLLLLKMSLYAARKIKFR